MSQKSVVRLGSGVVALLSFVLPLVMQVPESLPATAMGSALLLYLERVLTVFAILLFVLVFLYRSFVHGELPRAISGRGAEWSDIVGGSRELHTRIDELDIVLTRVLEALGMER